MMALRLQELTTMRLAGSSEQPSYKAWDEQQMMRATKKQNVCQAGSHML